MSSHQTHRSERVLFYCHPNRRDVFVFYPQNASKTYKTTKMKKNYSLKMKIVYALKYIQP